MRLTPAFAAVLLLGGCALPDTAPSDAAANAGAAPVLHAPVASSTVPGRPAAPAAMAEVADASGGSPAHATPHTSPAAAAPPGTQRYGQDDPGDPSAELPPAIVRALQTDELVLTCRGGTRGAQSRFTPEWVGVRRLDLNRDGRPDWIVNGRHPCLRTSYATAWWVYADAGAGPRVVLRAEPAALLEVLPTSTHGFRDLRMHLVNGRGAPLVADSRYDGETYAPSPVP